MKHAKSYLIQGDRLKQSGKIEDAIEKYQLALTINSNFFQVINKLAETYENQKKFSSSLNYYLRAIQVKPQALKVIRQLSGVSKNVLSKVSQLDEALAISKVIIRSLTISETDSNLEKPIGQVYEEIGKVILKLSVRKEEFKPAIAFWKEEVHRQPTSDWFHYNLGLVLSRQGKYSDAIDSYRKALEINPKSYNAWVELGLALKAQGIYDEAVRCALEAIAINPNLQHPYYLLNLPYAQKDRDINKFFSDYVNHIDYSQLKSGGLYVAQQLKDMGNYSEAISISQKCLYHQVEQTKPDFIRQYWEISQPQEPNFLIIGVGKCGTTALYDYLVQHPQILPAITKEPSYFNRFKGSFKKMSEADDFSLLDEEKRFYLAHFLPRPDRERFITGEASVDTIHSGMEKLVHSWFPKIKLIVILRHPTKRLVSHYEQGLKGKKEQRSFEIVMSAEMEMLEKMEDLESQIVTDHKDFRYVHKGLYLYFLKPWLNLFGKEQILILRNEDLLQNPADIMKQTFNFLNLPDCTQIQYIPRNVGYYPSYLNPSFLDRISNFYKPHTQKLEAYLNRSFDWYPS